MTKTFFLCLAAAIVSAACQPSNAPLPDAKTSAMESPYFFAEDKIIDIDGVNIRYRDEGPKEARTLVMVHGFTSSLETWDELAEALKSDLRIVRLDLPGHGLSGESPDSDYSNDTTAQLLAAFIEQENIKSPVIVGNSLGGLVAWRLAANTPDLVSNLVLIAPGGFSINGVTENPVDVPMMVKLYLTKAPEAGVKQASAALYGDPSKLPEKRIERTHYMMKQPGNGEAFVARAAQFTLPDPTDALHKVSTPTLIIWGDKDVMVPPTHASRFITALPSAQLLTYEGIGHLPQEETPEKLAADIRAFLAETGE